MSSLLEKAFKLAESAIQADNNSDSTANDLYTASIEAFQAVLAMKFVKDEERINLIRKEIMELQNRQKSYVKRIQEEKSLQTRTENLSKTTYQDLKERYDHLHTQSDDNDNNNNTTKPKSTLSLEEIAKRLELLNSETTSTTPTSHFHVSKLDSKEKQNVETVLKGNDWKFGLDPDVIELLEQTRDETLHS